MRHWAENPSAVAQRDIQEILTATAVEVNALITQNAARIKLARTGIALTHALESAVQTRDVKLRIMFQCALALLNIEAIRSAIVD